MALDLSWWDQVGSYNLGTAVTGAIIIYLGARAWINTSSVLAKALSLAFCAIGGYMLYRGSYWFAADHLAPPGEKYHPWFYGHRWTIWLVIIPMELLLVRLYMKIFEDHRAQELLIIAAVVLSYVVGGLL